MCSLLLRSHICLRRGDQPRLSGQGRKSVCHLTRVLRDLTNSIPIRSNVTHIHLSIIWNGPRMASIRIHSSDCFLLALESMDI
jgi:hypothetical protein